MMSEGGVLESRVDFTCDEKVQAGGRGLESRSTDCKFTRPLKALSLEPCLLGSAKISKSDVLHAPFIVEGLCPINSTDIKNELNI